MNLGSCAVHRATGVCGVDITEEAKQEFWLLRGNSCCFHTLIPVSTSLSAERMYSCKCQVRKYAGAAAREMNFFSISNRRSIERSVVEIIG